MQFNIEKHNFCQLEGISNIKNHLEKIKGLTIKDSKATGILEMNLSYLDIEGMECFKSMDFPFDLDLDMLKILDVVVGRVEVYQVEGQGLDINYELVINFLPVEEAEEIKVIEEKDIEVEEEPVKEVKGEKLEQIKEDMKEYYEDKLADNLTRESVESFLDFFESKSSYYKLKCLYVEKEEDLEAVAKEYNVKFEQLLAGYDRQSHKVIFSIG